MNPSFSKSNPAAEETAALWAARLDGSELSASDRAELDEWLAADPAHRGLLSGYSQFSADLERPLASLVESGAVQMPGAAASASSQKRSRLKLFTGSALAAIAAAIMFAVWIAQPQTQFNEIATAIAQRQSITLSDGTRVDLNAHRWRSVPQNVACGSQPEKPSSRSRKIPVGLSSSKLPPVQCA